MLQELRPVPKPSHKRNKPKRKSRGAITDKVSREVLRRSGGRCERCGRSTAYAFERAHLLPKGQGGSGSIPWNIALLCGTSVNSGTCHNWIDYTSDGRKWALEFSERLKEQYRVEDWE